MSRLVLGTARFGMEYGIANEGGKVGQPMAKNMLQLAAKSGIDMLDTAIAYGESEASLGKTGTKGFRLITKLPGVPAGCINVDEWVNEQIGASLARLGVTQLYGLLLHKPSQLLEPNGEALYCSLRKLQSAGVTQKIGVSIYGPNELERLCKKYRFDLVQSPFNLVDRRLLTSGWMQRLKAAEVEIHVRSVFLQGLLLLPREAIPSKFQQWSFLWKRWHCWLAYHSVPAVQACLAFPLAFPEIDHVIVGSDNVTQLEQIVRAASSVEHMHLPDIACEEEDMINPTRWSEL